jgi:hypothetical protein
MRCSIPRLPAASFLVTEMARIIVAMAKIQSYSCRLLDGTDEAIFCMINPSLSSGRSVRRGEKRSRKGANPP